MPDRCGAKHAATRRARAFGVERGGDLLVRLALGVQVANPGFNPLPVDIVVIAHAIPDQLLPATRARLPIDLEPQLARDAALIGADLGDDQPEQMLAIGHRRRGGMPHPREIFADGENRLAILGGDLSPVLVSPSRVFLFRGLDRAQFLFPELFEVTRHQPIFGLDRLVLPLRAVRLETNTFAAQLPLCIQGLGL